MTTQTPSTAAKKAAERTVDMKDKRRRGFLCTLMRFVRFLVGMACWVGGLALMGVQHVPFYRWIPGGFLLALAFIVWDGDRRKSNANLHRHEKAGDNVEDSP